jgi:AraC family transcriptional regulator
MDSASALAIEGLVLEILAEAIRGKTSSTAEKKSPRWFCEVREFLHANFSESMQLEDLVRIADVHPVHLARVFRHQTGCTVGEYVRRLRLEFACGRVSSSNESLCEIALAAGFTDQSHFTRAFKNRFGITPGEYRRISRPR